DGHRDHAPGAGPVPQPTAGGPGGLRGGDGVPPAGGPDPGPGVDGAQPARGLVGGRRLRAAPTAAPRSRAGRSRRHLLRLPRVPRPVVVRAGGAWSPRPGARTAGRLRGTDRAARVATSPGARPRDLVAPGIPLRPRRGDGPALHPGGRGRVERRLAAVPVAGVHRRPPGVPVRRGLAAVRRPRSSTPAPTVRRRRVTPRHDVVVIGSGHNGLICAAYLARSGLDVHVVEKDTVVGGATSTVERYPGHLTDRGSSAHLMIRHTGIPEELDLASHGLRYVDCDPWGFAPAPPGSDEPPLVFHRDLDATCASISEACGRGDADAYREFVARWDVLAGRMMKGFAARPTAARLGGAFLGPKDLRDPFGAVQTFLSSGDALLDSTFSSERLKAALSWFGAQSGPPMSHPATAPMIGFAALMHRVPPGRAIGGSGA